MAIDTSLLQFTPVKPAGADPLATLARYNDLQNSQVQQQSNKLQLDEQTRQIQRSKDADAAYASSYGPDGLDIDKLKTELSTRGLGSMIPAIQEHQSKYQETLAQTAKANAEAAKATQEANVHLADAAGLVGSHLQDKSIDYDPHTFIVNGIDAIQKKAVTGPAQASLQQTMAQVNAALQQDPTGTSAKGLVKQWADAAVANSPAAAARAFEERKTVAAEQTAQSKADQVKREGDKDAAEAAEKKSKAALTAYALAPPGTPAQQTAYAALTDADKNTVRDLKPDDVLGLASGPAAILQNRRAAATEQNEQARIGIERARLSLEQNKANRDNSLNSSTPFEQLPIALKPIALALSNGDQSFGSLSRYPQDIKERLIAAAYEKNQGLTENLFNAKKDFKLQGDADKIGSMTRVMGHLEQARTDSPALGFSPAGAVGATTTANTPMHIDARAISDEFGYLVKHGALTQEEAKDYTGLLNSSRQGVRDAAIKSIEDKMKSQFEATYQKYKVASGGTVLPAHEYFDKKTMDILQREDALPEGYVRPGTAPKPAPGAPAPTGPTPATNTGLQHLSTDELLKQLAK